MARCFLAMAMGMALCMTNSFAQQQGESSGAVPPPAQPKPLELPNFIIEGVEQLNVASGVKQIPEKPARLNAKMLDSLNSIEKQQSPLLPVEPLPAFLQMKEYKHGFMRAEYGRFNTPGIEAGYGFNMKGYELYASAGLDLSGGDVAGSGYNKFFAGLSSDYIAPDKFWIFGGSRTRAFVKLNNCSYKLYSLAEPIDRNAFGLNFGVDVDGNSEGYQFKTGAGFRSLSLTSDPADATDNNLSGYLKVQNFFGDYLVGGNLLLDLHTIKGDAANFAQADASLSLVKGEFTLNGNAGFQFAGSSDGTNRGGLLLSGSMEYRINKFYTMKAEISTGLARESMIRLFEENPYVSFNSNIDFPYDMMALKTYVYYHPTDKMGLTAGFKYAMTDRRPTFVPADSGGTFDVAYMRASVMNIEGEGYWNVTAADRFILNANIAVTSLDENSNTVPNEPNLKLSADYARTWSETFGTHLGLVYYGQRYADIENKKELAAFVNLKFRADYRISKDFSIFARFDNLLNSNIYIWNGYKERSMFGAVGIMWQL